MVPVRGWQVVVLFPVRYGKALFAGDKTLVCFPTDWVGEGAPMLRPGRSSLTRDSLSVFGHTPEKPAAFSLFRFIQQLHSLL